MKDMLLFGRSGGGRTRDFCPPSSYRDLLRQRALAGSGAIATTVLFGILLALGLKTFPNSSATESEHAFIAFPIPLPKPPPLPLYRSPPVDVLVRSRPPATPGGVSARPTDPPATLLPDSVGVPVAESLSLPLDHNGQATDGVGHGHGAGDGAGSGSGARTGRDWMVRARHTAGFITLADYPAAAAQAGAQGTVGLRYTILPTGRVRDCRVVTSSGNAALDETTCRLVERRYVFRSARDRDGRATTEVREDRFAWRLVQ